MDRIDGHVIALNWLHKHNKICIIQVYLPSDKKESQKIQAQVETLIKRKSQNKFKIVIMKDFNAIVNPLTDRLRKNGSFNSSWYPEICIFDSLKEQGFIDIHSLW